MKNINITVTLNINGKDRTTQYSIPYDGDDHTVKGEEVIIKDKDTAIRENIGIGFNMTNHFISSYKQRSCGASPKDIGQDIISAVKGRDVYNHPTKHTYLIYGDLFVYVYDPTNGSLVTMYKGSMMGSLDKISRKENQILIDAVVLDKKQYHD